jgi:hypothetical protein
MEDISFWPTEKEATLWYGIILAHFLLVYYKIFAEFARAMYDQLLLLRCFTLWQQTYDRQQQLLRHAEHIIHLSRRSRLRRIFEHWKHCILVCSVLFYFFKLGGYFGVHFP